MRIVVSEWVEDSNRAPWMGTSVTTEIRRCWRKQANHNHFWWRGSLGYGCEDRTETPRRYSESVTHWNFINIVGKKFYNHGPKPNMMSKSEWVTIFVGYHFTNYQPIQSHWLLWFIAKKSHNKNLETDLIEYWGFPFSAVLSSCGCGITRKLLLRATEGSGTPPAGCDVLLNCFNINFMWT